MKNKEDISTSLFRELLDKSERNDVDKMGIEEFKQTLTKLEPSLSAKELEGLVQEVDKNGDGEVDMQEFYHLVLHSGKIAALVEKHQSKKQSEEEDLSTSVFLR